MSRSPYCPDPLRECRRKVAALNADKKVLSGSEATLLRRVRELTRQRDELLAALVDCVDAEWLSDSHTVSFDSTVMFGDGYDFSGLDGYLREEFLAEYQCIVWPSGGIGAKKWSAYCTYDGSLWFEKFDTAADAKDACMSLLGRVIPDHPAMKARAAIASVKGAA